MFGRWKSCSDYWIETWAVPTIMDHIGLLEAWSRWASGPNELRDARLWGLEIWWWGRIGILLSASGISGLVVDIIGPKKLREFGRKLKSKLPLHERAKSVGRSLPKAAAAVGGFLLFCSVSWLLLSGA